MAQQNDATGDNGLTVEQCINDNTDTSLKPLEEKALLEAGIIEEKLDNRAITKEACREIIARTPDGSPVERIIMAGNVTQELDVIQRSMKEAVEGDVNGDGAINAQDSRAVSASSYAASHAAQQTVRMAVKEDVNDTSVIQHIKVEPAAYVQYRDDGDGGGGAGGGSDSSATLPSYERVQDQARDAAESEGASPKAAAAGGNCAADVALADGTYLEIVKGNMVFEAPAKEMLWKDRDVTELVMSPSALDSIEELKQQLDEAEESDEIRGQCVRLAEKMQAEFIDSGSAFTITPFGSDVQDIALGEGTGWKWEIVASNEGTHHLTLYIEMRSTEGEEARAIAPSPFDDDIIVRATLWQKSRSFVGHNWQFFLAPFLLPIAFYLWRKYKQRSNEHEEQGYI